GNGTVIENTTTSVTATVGAFDVAFVDFYLNDALSGSLPAPFTFAFQAVPALGAPGSSIKVSAIATDTSGNRGLASTTLVAITPDVPPTATITLPGGTTSIANGEHVDVTVTASDDVGLAQVNFKA